MMNTEFASSRRVESRQNNLNQLKEIIVDQRVQATVLFSLAAVIGAASGIGGLELGALPGVLAALCAVSAVTDWRSRKIYNWATYTAILFALGLNAISELWPHPAWGAVGLQASVLGLAVCFTAKFLIYATAGGGAGDVKLAAAVGALLGPADGILVICYTYVLAGIVALCWVILRHGPLHLLRACGQAIAGCVTRRPVAKGESLMTNQTLPLGVFFALATLLVWCDLDFARMTLP